MHKVLTFILQRNGDDVENRGGDERGEEEGTTTSPPRPLSTTSSSPPAGGGTNSGAVSMTSVNSVVWSKSGSLLLGLVSFFYYLISPFLYHVQNMGLTSILYMSIMYIMYSNYWYPGFLLFVQLNI